jgi:hypothetical protein
MTQFTTLETARAIAAQLGNIGGGVIPYHAENELETAPPLQDTDPHRSGIYIPQYAMFATPEQADHKFYHFRFQNGAEGFNAGLIQTIMTMFPTRWPLMIGTEVTAAARSTE